MRHTSTEPPLRQQAGCTCECQRPLTDKAQLDKNANIFATLVDETRQSKVKISDAIAQRSEYAADIKDLKAWIETRRRALDPEQLGGHVADNIDQFMGKAAQATIRGAEANLKASDQSLSAAISAAKEITSKADKLNIESHILASITTQLKERVKRLFWLSYAGGGDGRRSRVGAYFLAAGQIKTSDFDHSIDLITQDDNAYWCSQEKGQTINRQSGAKFCAINMPG